MVNDAIGSAALASVNADAGEPPGGGTEDERASRGREGLRASPLGAEEPSLRASPWAVLRNRQFRWFLGSWIAASTGYSVFAISIVWLAYQATQSFLVVGAVLAVERAAYCVTFAVAPIADRVRNQRTIFVASYPIQAVAAGALAYGALTHTLGLVELFGLVVLLSVLWDLSWAAANAAPGILLGPDEQFAATGVSGLLGGANTIAGYAAGGVLILVLGAGGGMALYAGLLIVAGLLALPLRIAPPARSAEPFAASFRDGWKALGEGPGRPLLQLATVDAVQGFFSAAPVVILALVAVRGFGAEGFAYASLFVAYVVGGIAAGLGFARWNPRGRVGILLVGSLFAGAATIALVAVEPPVLAVASGIWFSVGFAQAAYVDVKYAFLRGSVPAGRLARVVSNLYTFPGITSTVGVLVVGILAVGASVPTLTIEVTLGLLAAALASVALPRVRALRF
jgi:hypothetical protein